MSVYCDRSLTPEPGLGLDFGAMVARLPWALYPKRRLLRVQDVTSG